MGSAPSAAGRNVGKLKVVVTITAVYLIAEIVGGVWSGSLALLADAGHMFTDVGGLALALFAIHMASKPANPSKTYGYYRAEILAALTNAVVLFGISFYILYEAYLRIKNPPEIATGTMFIVASIGLVVNLFGVWLLRAGSKESLNMKGAYFEIISDLLTSIGVIVGSIVIWLTGWIYVDPIISAGIGLFILPRTWILLRDAVSVLLEGTPSDVNLVNLRKSMESMAGVLGLHDLHVWTLTSGKNAMSTHVISDGTVTNKVLLAGIMKTLKEDFFIDHVTVQIEERDSLCESSHI